MPKLLIVPANGAIRYNPENPKGFPDAHNQALVPGVAEALDFYAQEGYTIAVCENAGAVERGIVTLQEKLSELLVLMTTIAPQIDHLILCTDYKGLFTYLLSKPTKTSFPELRRLRSKGVVNSNHLTAPDDKAVWWEAIDTAPFRKPDPGMVDVLMRQVQPSHTVYVWEREEDKDALSSPDYNQIGTVSCQSASVWRQALNPELDIVQQAQQAVSQSQASVVNPRTKMRRFEQVNPAYNVNRFWTIAMPSDLTIEINWGRIGSRGRSQPTVKTYPNAQQAIQDYEARISAQLRDGYIETN